MVFFSKLRGYADFFFQLNLLPPYVLRSQGDKIVTNPKAVNNINEPKRQNLLNLLRWKNEYSMFISDTLGLAGTSTVGHCVEAPVGAVANFCINF